MQTILLQVLIILSGIWLIAVGVLMFVRPQKAIHFLSKAASTNLINYLELSLRGIWGVALLLYADLSRFPEVFHWLGVFVIVSSVVLMSIPRKWHHWYALWWSSKFTPLQVRIMSPFTLVFGVFFIYAVV